MALDHGLNEGAKTRHNSLKIFGHSTYVNVDARR
uniref:Uncharacterized protein n=1 Tax=Tetranychus urticae TaxID=32264 RepID=T1JVJ0_TETUR